MNFTPVPPGIDMIYLYLHMYWQKTSSETHFLVRFIKLLSYSEIFCSGASNPAPAHDMTEKRKRDDDESGGGDTLAAHKVALHYSGRDNQSTAQRQQSPIYHLRCLNNWVRPSQTGLGFFVFLFSVSEGGCPPEEGHSINPSFVYHTNAPFPFPARAISSSSHAGSLKLPLPPPAPRCSLPPCR